MRDCPFLRQKKESSAGKKSSGWSTVIKSSTLSSLRLPALALASRRAALWVWPLHRRRRDDESTTLSTDTSFNAQATRMA